MFKQRIFQRSGICSPPFTVFSLVVFLVAACNHPEIRSIEEIHNTKKASITNVNTEPTINSKTNESSYSKTDGTPYSKTDESSYSKPDGTPYSKTDETPYPNTEPRPNPFAGKTPKPITEKTPTPKTKPLPTPQKSLKYWVYRYQHWKHGDNLFEVSQKLKTFGEEAARVFISHFKNPDMIRRQQAATFLKRLGIEALKPLFETMNHDDPYMRGYASYALFKMGDRRSYQTKVAKPIVVPQLIKWMSSTDDIRFYAAYAIDGKMFKAGLPPNVVRIADSLRAQRPQLLELPFEEMYIVGDCGWITSSKITLDASGGYQTKDRGLDGGIKRLVKKGSRAVPPLIRILTDEGWGYSHKVNAAWILKAIGNFPVEHRATVDKILSAEMP